MKARVIAASLAALVATFALFLAINVAAQHYASATQPLRYSVPTDTWWAASSRLAEKWGLFSHTGIEIESSHAATGLIALNAVLSGNADVAFVSAIPVVRAIAARERLVVLGRVMAAKHVIRLIVRRKNEHDWLRHPIGFSRNTISETYLFARLREMGKKDAFLANQIQLVDLRNYSTGFLILLDNKISAVAIHEPFATMALASPADTDSGAGFIDLSNPDLYVAHCFIVATENTWENKRDALVKFMLAINAAAANINANRARIWNQDGEFLEPHTAARAASEAGWMSADFTVVAEEHSITRTLDDETKLLVEMRAVPHAADLRPHLAPLTAIKTALEK